MRIVISTFGARGDVQPYIALAVGLQRAGHTVTLVTSHTFTQLIASYGVHTRPTAFSLADLSLAPEAQAVIRSGSFIRQARLMRAMMRRSPAAQDETWAAIQEADLVIQSPAGTGALEALAVRRIAAVLASPIPFAATREFPAFNLGRARLSLGGTYNALTHALMHRVLWSVMGGPLTDHLRRKLGLRPWRSFAEVLAHSRAAGVPVLYGYSAHVLPRPADWDPAQTITGYWFLETPPGWSPSAELLRFLDAGPPPVYVGFGSMLHAHPERQTQLALRALELTGQRGVLATGWGALSRQPAPPPNVLFVDDVPHAWLFPRAAAVVHHGGAGTTSAGLRAGVPSVLTPFAVDQWAWAERVAALGVGPRAPGIKALTAEKLAAAIHTAVTDPALRVRATALGQRLRAEDGLARAVELIERHAASRRLAPAAA